MWNQMSDWGGGGDGGEFDLIVPTNLRGDVTHELSRVHH